MPASYCVSHFVRTISLLFERCRFSHCHQLFICNLIRFSISEHRSGISSNCCIYRRMKRGESHFLWYPKLLFVSLSMSFQVQKKRTSSSIDYISVALRVSHLFCCLLLWYTKRNFLFRLFVHWKPVNNDTLHNSRSNGCRQTQHTPSIANADTFLIASHKQCLVDQITKLLFIFYLPPIRQHTLNLLRLERCAEPNAYIIWALCCCIDSKMPAQLCFDSSIQLRFISREFLVETLNFAYHAFHACTSKTKWQRTPNTELCMLSTRFILVMKTYLMLCCFLLWAHAHKMKLSWVIKTPNLCIKWEVKWQFREKQSELEQMERNMIGQSPINSSE